MSTQHRGAIVWIVSVVVLIAALGGTAYADQDSIDGVLAEDGNILNVGIDPGSPSAGPVNGDAPAAPSTFTVRTIFAGCSQYDAVPCATEMALYCPDAPPDVPGAMWRVSTTRVYAIADTAMNDPLVSTTECSNFAGTVVEAGPSEADVREFLMTVVPVSGAGTSPPVDASGMAQFVLGLPLIVFAVGPSEVAVGPVPLVGHNVEVAAEAMSYVWASGGAQTESDEPGRAYDGAPCTRSDCDSYLHLPAFTVPGTHAVTLTTTWMGRYRVDGGAWIDIAEPIERVSAPTLLNVREARGVLVSR